MILPDKHLRLSETTLGIGAAVLRLLSQPRTLDELYSRFHSAADDAPPTAARGFDAMLEGLLLLYALGAIDVRPDGGIRRCAS